MSRWRMQLPLRNGRASGSRSPRMGKGCAWHGGKNWPWGDASDPKCANVSDNPMLPKHELMARKRCRKAPVLTARFIWPAMRLSTSPDDITPSTDAVAAFLANPESSAGVERALVQRQGWIVWAAAPVRLPWEWSSVPARFHAADIGFRCAKILKVSSPTTEQFVLSYRMY